MSLPLYSVGFWAVLIFASVSIAIQFILAGLIIKRYIERRLIFVLNLGLTLLCYATGAIFAVLIQLFEASIVNQILNNLLFAFSSTFFLNFCLLLFYKFSKQKNILYLLLLLVSGCFLSVLIPITSKSSLNLFFGISIPTTSNPYLSLLFGIIEFIPYIILLQNAQILKKRAGVAVKGRFTSMQLFVISFLTGSAIFFINSSTFGISPTLQPVFYILTWFFDTIGWVAIYLGFVQKVKTEKIESE